MFVNSLSMVRRIQRPHPSIETTDLGLIPSCVKPRLKNLHSQLSWFTPVIERNSGKPASCAVDEWAGGSLIRRPKYPFMHCLLAKKNYK